jgi:hypothetical protein
MEGISLQHKSVAVLLNVSICSVHFQSLPLLVPHVQLLSDYIEASLKTEKDPQRIAELLFASVYIPTGWYLMARMDEILKLKEGDYSPMQYDPKNRVRVDMITLLWRKTNQADPTKSQ